MVTKLLKYELKYYLKRMLPLYLVSIVLCLLNRVIQFFETPKTSYSIMFYSSCAAIGIFSVALLLMAQIFIIIRFYTNLFKNEGYLMMTLPVTMDQHLTAKLTASVLLDLISGAVIMISLSIATMGDVFVEIMKAINYVFGYSYKIVGAHMIGYVILLILMALVSLISKVMTFYFCLCIGQLAKKGRVALSVGVYIGLYFAAQIAGTILMIVFTILDAKGFFNELFYYVINHITGFVYALECGAIVVTAIFSMILYLICRHILKNKLNIE